MSIEEKISILVKMSEQAFNLADDYFKKGNIIMGNFMLGKSTAYGAAVEVLRNESVAFVWKDLTKQEAQVIDNEAI